MTTNFILGNQGGEMLYAQSVGLANKIAKHTKTSLFIKQESHMWKKQKAINLLKKDSE